MRYEGYEGYKSDRYSSPPTGKKREGREERERSEERVQGMVERSGAGWRGSGSMAEGGKEREPRRAKDALVQVRYKRTGEKGLTLKGEF
jgi:hypothetical protein